MDATDMERELETPGERKPLAGGCKHVWQDQESPYVVAQVCSLCKLFRYKAGVTADWEYRAPIPIAHPSAE